MMAGVLSYGSSDAMFRVITSGGAASGGMVEPAIFRCNAGVSLLHFINIL